MGNGTAMRKQPLFWKTQAAWPPRKGSPNHWVSWAIADQQWKLVTNGNMSHYELYDIEADFKEEQDLASENPQITMRLLQQLKQWQATLPKHPTGKVFSKERKVKSN